MDSPTAILNDKACYRALYAYNTRIVEDILPRCKGSLPTYDERVGWEAVRLPHRKASSFPASPDAHPKQRTRKTSRI